MKYSVVIIDDEILAVELLADYCSKLDHLEVKEAFTDPQKAYNYLSTHRVDLVFLDINMPELGGLDLAKVLSPAVKVIFATAYREFGVEAFELKALDYLLKPIAYPRFLQAVQRFLETQNPQQQSAKDHLIIRVDRRDHKVELSDMVYVEGLKDYVKIHLEEGVLLTKDSVGLFMKKLPPHRFLRIHKSYIVNKEKVSAVGKEEVLVGEKSLPVGITFREEVRNIFAA
jgi:DNA-binding LytR/AlgR family response regulator